jgi:hypothetical protein
MRRVDDLGRFAWLLRRFRNHGIATDSADRQASGALWSRRRCASRASA